MGNPARGLYYLMCLSTRWLVRLPIEGMNLTVDSRCHGKLFPDLPLLKRPLPYDAGVNQRLLRHEDCLFRSARMFFTRGVLESIVP